MSFTPRSRFTLDFEQIAAWRNERDDSMPSTAARVVVIGEICATVPSATTMLSTAPPTNPSIVFPGLIVAASGCRPKR